MKEETQDIIDGTFKSTQEQIDLGVDRTIFHALLESDLPPEEKLHSRLWQEGLIVVGAGSDTTATALAWTHFWLLEKPETLKKLREELERAMPDKFEPAQLSVVENLPYLVCFLSILKEVFLLILVAKKAVVNEGLRYYALFSSTIQAYSYQALIWCQ